MVRYEVLISPHTDDWIEEGGILEAKPMGMSISPRQWSQWVGSDSKKPDFTGVPLPTQLAVENAIKRQRKLEELGGDHMAFYAACTGKLDFPEADAMALAGQVDYIRTQVAQYGWDSNWGFEELKRQGTLIFDVDPAEVPTLVMPDLDYGPDGISPVAAKNKRRHIVPFRTFLSGASLDNLLNLDRHVPPNRNLPNIVPIVYERSTLLSPRLLPLITGQE